MQLGDRALLHGELGSPESSFLSTSLALCSRNTSAVAFVGCNSRLSRFALRAPAVVDELVDEPVKTAGAYATADVMHLELAS